MNSSDMLSSRLPFCTGTKRFQFLYIRLCICTKWQLSIIVPALFAAFCWYKKEIAQKASYSILEKGSCIRKGCIFLNLFWTLLERMLGVYTMTFSSIKKHANHRIWLLNFVVIKRVSIHCSETVQ